LRDKQDIFKMGRDIGGVCQLLETQLASICNLVRVHVRFVYLTVFKHAV